MKRWWMISALAVAALLASGPVNAQTSQDDDYEEDGQQDDDRFAFGVGAGLVEPSGEVETYLMASLRIRVHGRGDDNSGQQRRGDEGITGYIEPEVGYWKSSDSEDGPGGEDLLVGANLVGVVPMGMVDSFFGVGAGVHFVDATLLEDPDEGEDSATKLGVNAHFGLDLFITETVSAFGVGRFDLVQDSRDEVQTKVYLGVRSRF
ncbi:MAG TPA: hypothetical protein VMW27_17260 [Thermoanaerobaculia bacterium]|nr:hypothetical protein [Thermoanaerobaculia bacterium]